MLISDQIEHGVDLLRDSLRQMKFKITVIQQPKEGSGVLSSESPH